MTKQNRLAEDLLYALCWAAIIMLVLFALFCLQIALVSFSLSMLALLALCATGVAVVFFAKDRFRMEYDYTFTNGLLEFARVLGRSRRVELGCMRVANVAACGYVAHAEFKRYLSIKGVEKKNWFLNRDGNLFYFYYIKDGKKHMIIIEPSEEMVELIRRELPEGVYQG